MALLVLSVLWARRAARAAAPLACAVAFGALVVLDVQSPLPPVLASAAATALVALLVIRARRRALAIDGSTLGDIELGALLITVALAAAERVDGSLDGRVYPAVYVCIGLMSAFARPAARAFVVAFATGLEVIIRMIGLGEPTPIRALYHLGFMIVFAALNVAVLRGEITRVRKASRKRLDAEIARLRDDARSYRLLTAPTSVKSPTMRRDEERIARSGVEEIHQSVLFALRLLRESLGLYTAMLLWQNDDGTHLRISELVSDAQGLSEGPFLAGDGVFGAAISQRSAVCLGALKPSYKLPYYLGPCPVRVVCALPVFEHGQLRGVLVVDRLEDKEFTPRERVIVEEAGRYAVRAIQNERVFVQLERAKVEQGKLYRAAEALGSALTEGDVLEAGVKSAREVALFDFAAVTLFDEGTKTHEVRAVSGEGSDALVGARFSHNASLAAMVVQNRHPLPYRGEFDPAHQVLFSKRLAPPAMPSILVLPLLVHERALGTLVLGAKRRGAFGDAVRPTLEVLARHMAVSLANARMVKKLEELATTDGLTGLLNKRAMLDMADQKVASATRFSRHLSVLVTDIDFFKKVNDTHGHDVGDIVIRGMGEILRRAKRTTDAVARFGGEEFVIICEETDAKGAMLLAERVRKEVEGKAFVTPHGPIKVTCSVGIATFPEAGRDWEALFKSADAALYASKKSGRNRSTAWSSQRKFSAA